MRGAPTLLVAATLLAGASAQDVNADLGIGNAQLPPQLVGANPFNTYFNCGFVQYIVLASELQAAGVQPWTRLDAASIIVDVPSNLTWQSVGVNIAHVDYSEFEYYATSPSFGYHWPEFGVVPFRDNQPWTDVAGWNTFDATRNFFWNGTQNIVIEFTCFGGATQYPSGTPYGQPFFGPTIRATTYPANPTTGATRGTAYRTYVGSNLNCLEYGDGTNARFDMRLTFTTRPLNDDCARPYFFPEGNWVATIAGATTAPGLPGAPPMEQDTWYHYVNQTNVTRSVEISTCAAQTTFDPVIAVYSGSCGALQLVVIDDDGCGSAAGDAKVSFLATPGQNFFIAVGRKIGTSMTGDGSFGISLSTAAPATTTVIGQGCGYGGAPAATLSGTNPVLGSIGTISVTGAPAGAFVALLLGMPSAPVPFLDGGCPLHLDPLNIMIFRFGMTDAVGAWSFSEQLPSAPSLAGVTAGLQAALFSPFHSPSTATTNALLLTFGA
jgi:hypothetical protein